MAYVKEVFDPVTLDNAKNIVLSDDPNNPNKFITETNQLVNVILDTWLIAENTLILDFGCGMGRISKQLIDRANCSIIGLDQSLVMLQHATQYVNNSKFTPVQQYNEVNSIDVVLSILVLQHVEYPLDAIQNIYNIIKPGGYFILVNEPVRLVPSELTDDGWIIWNNDNVDIHSLVASKFKEVARSDKAGALPVILFRKEE